MIELHSVADDTGGSDDHARSVVDGEVVADGGCRMDVYARLAVCHLGDDAWNERHPQRQQLVGDAVVGDGLDDRIAGDDFSLGLCGGVSQIGRLDIGSQGLSQDRQFLDESLCQFRCLSSA